MTTASTDDCTAIAPETLGNYGEGLAIRKKVLGSEYVDRSLAKVTDFDRAFQHVVTAHCWGTVWNRDGLDRQTRSLLTIAMMIALNRGHELRLHVQGALRNGCTEKQISEVLLQAAVYVGIPAGVDAYRIAMQALSEFEESDGEADS